MSTSATITLPTGRSLQIPTGLFIDNNFVPAIKGGTFEYATKGSLHVLRLTIAYNRTINPSTEQVICTVAEGLVYSFTNTFPL
jgi:aldehyde dehydrogenase (NAD+)